jgi:hypothetical protein
MATQAKVTKTRSVDLRKIALRMWISHADLETGHPSFHKKTTDRYNSLVNGKNEKLILATKCPEDANIK